MDVTATTQTGNQQGTILDGAESADQKICGMTTCIMDAMTVVRCWHKVMKNKIEEGDTVNYHAVIGEEPPTSTGHVVRKIGNIPSSPKEPVAWITGKSGCVCLSALSKAVKLLLFLGIVIVSTGCGGSNELMKERLPYGSVLIVSDAKGNTYALNRIRTCSNHFGVTPIKVSPDNSAVKLDVFKFPEQK